MGLLAAAARQCAGRGFDQSGLVRSPDGLRLAWETQGEGRPLVALAGGPGVSHHGFHPYLGRLRARARVVYFDPRGRGESDAAASYRVTDDVSDLEALRRGLALDRIDLLGHSYGAHLALAYAVEHPDAVRRLVLVSPIVGHAAWRSHLAALAGHPGVVPLLDEVREAHGEVRLTHRATMQRLVHSLLPLYWCDPRAARRAGSVFRPRHHRARQNPAVYEAIVGRPFPELNGDLAGSTVDARLGGVRAPALIVHGECDRAAPAESVLALERALPAARRVVLTESGHAPFADQPRRFAELVATFLGEGP